MNWINDFQAKSWFIIFSELYGQDCPATPQISAQIFRINYKDNVFANIKLIIWPWTLEHGNYLCRLQVNILGLVNKEIGVTRTRVLGLCKLNGQSKVLWRKFYSIDYVMFVGQRHCSRLLVAVYTRRNHRVMFNMFLNI